jgi:DNA modification methylase
MSIVVVSPINLVTESLVFLLESYGYEAYADMKEKPILVLVDLINTDPPYSKPYPAPTIALIDSNQKKAKLLLALGYIACIDATQTSETLLEIIKTTLAKQSL